MREIKFRGKNNICWIYGPAAIDDFIILNVNGGMAKIIPDTVGQYTGLHDKNGKEIYEGDIVQIPDDYEEYGANAGELYDVYFAYGGFRLKPKYHSKAKGYWLEDDGEVEVIGNIYDNPELLEVNNE